MHALTRSSYFRRWQFLHQQARKLESKIPYSHKKRIMRELKAAGISRYGLMKEEARYLPNIISPHEHIGGVVYGHTQGKSAMLVATDYRIVFLDKMPLFVEEDEVRYWVVSGVDLGTNGLGSTVTLHTKIKDYKIRTFNRKCAENFVGYIEAVCMEHLKQSKEGLYD